MQYKKIYFKIQTQKEFNNELKDVENDFMLEFDEKGYITDSSARNPCSTWTNYTRWDQGWTEQDEDLNILWAAIKEYSQTMELEDIIANMDTTDIEKVYTTTYECEDIYHPGEYDFKITVEYVEEYETEE